MNARIEKVRSSFIDWSKDGHYIDNNGLAMVLSACIFIVSLIMDICKSKILAFKGFEILNNEGFTFFGWQ